MLQCGFSRGSGFPVSVGLDVNPAQAGARLVAEGICGHEPTVTAEGAQTLKL